MASALRRTRPAASRLRIIETALARRRPAFRTAFEPPRQHEPSLRPALPPYSVARTQHLLPPWAEELVVRVLKHHADDFRQLFAVFGNRRIESVHVHLSRLAGQYAAQPKEEGRFTGSVRPDDGNAFIGFECECHILECDATARKAVCEPLPRGARESQRRVPNSLRFWFPASAFPVPPHKLQAVPQDRCGGRGHEQPEGNDIRSGSTKCGKCMKGAIEATRSHRGVDTVGTGPRRERVSALVACVSERVTVTSCANAIAAWRIAIRSRRYSSASKNA